MLPWMGMRLLCSWWVLLDWVWFLDGNVVFCGQETNGEFDGFLELLLIAAGDVDFCSVAFQCSGDDET